MTLLLFNISAMATTSNPQHPSVSDKFTPVLQKIAIHLLDYMSKKGSGWTSMALGFVRNFNSHKMKSYPSFYRLLKSLGHHDLIAELLPPIFDDYPNIVKWFKTFQTITDQLFIVKKNDKYFYLLVNSDKLEQFNLLCAKNVQKELNLAEQPIPKQDNFPPLMTANGNSQRKEHDEALETSSTYSLSFEDRYSYDRNFFDLQEFTESLKTVQKKAIRKPPGLKSPTMLPRQEPPRQEPPRQTFPQYVAPYQVNPHQVNPHQVNPHQVNPWKYYQYHSQPRPNRIEIALKINKMYESGLISFPVANQLLREI